MKEPIKRNLRRKSVINKAVQICEEEASKKKKQASLSIAKFHKGGSPRHLEDSARLLRDRNQTLFLAEKIKKEVL